MTSLTQRSGAEQATRGGDAQLEGGTAVPLRVGDQLHADPIAEAEIYEHFNSLVGEGTALYISHRMSSSIFCDRILVIDGGRVADFAPHAKLMEKTDGLYYKLFMSQAENYNISGD